MALRTLLRVWSSIVMLCFSRPCCSIFGMISCSLLPLTCQSQFFSPTSEHLKLTLPSFSCCGTLGFMLSSYNHAPPLPNPGQYPDDPIIMLGNKHRCHPTREESVDHAALSDLGRELRHEQFLNAADESRGALRFLDNSMDTSSQCFFFKVGIGKGRKHQERSRGREP